jgi:hypothetical protein
VPPQRDNSHIQIAVPTRGQIHWQCIQRLSEIRDAAKGMPPIMWQPGNLCVAQNRNYLFKRFLETDCEILLMVDDDIICPPTLLTDLLPVADGYGMVGIPYPVTHPVAGALGFCVYNESPEGFTWADMNPGLNECDGIGTGCVAIPRKIVEEFGPDAFRVDPSSSAHVRSEDLLFCQDLRRAGYKVGYVYTAWWADHCRAVNLSPILEVTVSERLRYQEALRDKAVL